MRDWTEDNEERKMSIEVILNESGKPFPIPAVAAGLPREDVIESIVNIAKFAQVSPQMDRNVSITEDGEEKFAGMISTFRPEYME
jgi:hypothetical protein